MAEFQGRERTMQVVGRSVQSLIRQDQFANITVSQSLPQYTDLALNNLLYTAFSATGTYIAPAIAPLTTNAQHMVYNPAGSGKLIVPLACWMMIESGTPAIGGSIWSAITSSAEGTTPTAYTNSTKAGLGHTGTAVGIYDSDVTLDATPQWFMLAAETRLAADVESAGIYVGDMKGLFVVPEDRAFCMSRRDSAAGSTPLYQGGFIWAELTGVAQS